MIDPILARESAPEHRADFWSDLAAEMTAEAHTLDRARPEALERTAALSPVSSPPTEVVAEPAPRARWAPLAVAALVLAVVGVAAVALVGRGDRDPSATQVATAPEAAVATPAPAVGTADDPTPVRESEPAPVAGDESQVAPTAVAPTAVATPDVSADQVLADPVTGETLVPLAEWSAADVTWFATADPATSCRSLRHGALRYANPSGLVRPVAEPDSRFFGEAVAMAASPDFGQVAVLAGCDRDLRLHVASTDPNRPGTLGAPRLVWAGSGSTTAAELTWQAGRVTLNGIGEDSTPFFVEVDPESGRVAGTGLDTTVGPNPPANLDPRIVGASAVATWWNAADPAGARDVCGDGVPTTQQLWHRSAEGEWTPAFAEPVDVGGVVAFAVDETYSQVAFADRCPQVNRGRFFIATLRADGLISSVREVDIGTFATGHVSALRWVDGQTLYLETDNSNTAGPVLAFNWIFDEGRQGGILQRVLTD